MPLDRREFLSGISGATLMWALHISCSRDETTITRTKLRPPKPGGYPDEPGIDYRDWLILSQDGSVTAFTARTEIGQGLTTVLYNLICQALDLPEERVNVVLGDTELCPSDGPTTGSAATAYVAWGYWIACHRIRQDLVLLAAEVLGAPAEDLEYRQGEIVHNQDPGKSVQIGELADGTVRRMSVDPTSKAVSTPRYVDRETLNVNADAIVTGTLRYTGDYYPEGCVYGGRLLPAYHHHLTQCLQADVSRAKRVPGVVKAVRQKRGAVAVLGDSFTAVQNGLDAVQASWKEPDRPRELDVEAEIRSGAKLQMVVERRGDSEAQLRRSEEVIRETYITQFASQTPMETDTAIATVDGKRTKVWVGTQNPFLVRYITSRRRKVPESEVHVIGMPVGGGFGSKAGHTVGAEAAMLAEIAGTPVKFVYSRKDEFQRRARYKEAVVIDIASAVDSEGRLMAREIDIFQDEGYGTEGVYDIPHVRTRLYGAPMPTRHATMRGTSYAQGCFALESHTDMVARSIGMDPVTFRKLNVGPAGLRPLLDAVADMMDFPADATPPDHGLGFAICNHGDRQLGAVGAEVRVDRSSGTISVVRLCGAFDIGLVINKNTLSMGVRGAMMWGLGYALFEETVIDGHRCYTDSFSDYRIPRFSDCPPIDLVFLDNESKGSPRGCGEMPLPPTVGAICNAVHDAIDIRFYTLPMTPERVTRALRSEIVG